MALCPRCHSVHNMILAYRAALFQKAAASQMPLAQHEGPDCLQPKHADEERLVIRLGFAIDM